MTKQAFIISGFSPGVTAAGDEYAEFRAMLSRHGYAAVPVDIDWSRKTVSRFAADFISFYQSRRGEDDLVIGNSFGAMVALLTAGTLRPRKLMLCSMSAFFKEDLQKHDNPTPYIRRFGQFRWNDFSTLSEHQATARIDTVQTQVTITYGELEQQWYPVLVDRAVATAHVLNTDAICLAGAPHSMREPQYIASLDKVLQPI
jgi:pimeloyl-ACP methyl ester carboxylesterase